MVKIKDINRDVFISVGFKTKASGLQYCNKIKTISNETQDDYLKRVYPLIKNDIFKEQINNLIKEEEKQYKSIYDEFIKYYPSYRNYQKITSIKSKKIEPDEKTKKINKVRCMNKCEERDNLDIWLYDNHYSKLYMSGPLTNRTRKISNQVCYREIIKRCFNNVDILSTKINDNMIKIDFIKDLHNVHPSIAGTFIDYLIRRIISELLHINFTDDRAEQFCDDEDLEYKKVKDINHKTQDILEEIFIISLYHGMSFGQAPNEFIVNIICNKITNIDITPLIDFCKKLIENKCVTLNPVFGGKLNICNIPADGDLLIDDTIFEIKCTSGNNDIEHLFQLLGYAALSAFNENYTIKINKIKIINFISGIVTSYDISYISTDNYKKYIQLLM